MRSGLRADIPCRGFARGFKRGEQFVDPAVGGVDIVRCDVLRYIVQIEICAYART